MQNVMWFALIAICFVAYTVAVYEHGGNMRVKRYWVPAVAAPKIDMVTPARFSVETSPSTGIIDLPFIEHAITVPIQIVPTTSSLLVLPSAAVHEATQLEAAQARIAELEAVIAAKEEAHAEQVETITAKYERAEELHRKWVRFAHIARSRYRQAIVLGWEQPRRETRAKVLAEVIPIGTVAHPENVRFLMPTIRHDWIDRELVAA